MGPSALSRYLRTLSPPYRLHNDRPHDTTTVEALRLTRGRFVVLSTRWFTYRGAALPGDPRNHHLL